MGRITIWGARELAIVSPRDRFDGKGWREIRLNEARARSALSRLVGDPAAMASARALLSELSPGASLVDLGEHDVVNDLAWHVARGDCRALERVVAVNPARPNRVEKPAPAAPPPRREEPKKDPKVLTVRWDGAEAWCSDTVQVSGTTQDYADGATLQVDWRDRASGKALPARLVGVHGNAFSKSWQLVDVLPEKQGGKLVKRMEVDATAGGVKSPAPLALRFVPDAPRRTCDTPYGRFHLTVEQFVAKIEADLRFVPGWGGEVVWLGVAVPPGTGGEIAELQWPGYRWMRTTRGRREYWDGAAWQPLPAGFSPTKSFCVGFYQAGASFACQYGGTWPGTFPAWNVEDPPHQAKLRSWSQNIETTWGGKLDLKREGCMSGVPACCRYRVAVIARFDKQAAYAAGMLIVAPGDIRSNSALWFLGETRVAVAAHEFGHHLGNPDEYAGAPSVDPAVNGDGAVDGIDPDAIMGQHLGAVKKRHLKTVCAQLATSIQAASGKSYTYEPVPP